MISPNQVLAAAILAACTLGVSPSFAQGRDPAASEALFQEGRRLMKDGKLAAACSKFEESQRLDPAVGTLLNLADCEEQTGRTASAWQHWKQAVDQLPVGDRRRNPASARVVALEKILARLTLNLAEDAPRDVLITRNGVTLGLPSLGVPLPVDPGEHTIVVSSPGRELGEFEVTIAAAEQRTLTIAPGKPIRREERTSFRLPESKPRAHAVPRREPVQREEPAPENRGVSAGTWALFGVAAAGAGFGTYFALQAASARKDAEAACPSEAGYRRCWASAQDALDRDDRNSLLADVSFSVAALATGAGLYFLLTTGDERNPTHARLVPTIGGAEVHLDAHF